YANSTNGGVSFGPNVLVTSVGTPVSYIRPGDYLAIEAAPNGTVAVVWTDGRGADLDIYFASLPGDASTVLDTVPPGLTLQLDGTPVTAPYRFLCPPGPPHMIAAPSPQVVGSSRYTFGSWSDGQAQSHSITCGTTHAYTAYFTTEHQVTIATAPPGLTVVVDTIPAATPQTNWWPRGSVHTVSATSPQTQGSTRYVYLSWSDGGAQSHGLTITAPATYTANFRTEYEVAVDSSPSNLTLTVDGSPGTAPQSFWWAQGSTHAIGAPSPQAFGLTQYTFSGWSDSGAQNHTITANAPATYTANFGVEYQITVATQPTGIEVLVDGTPFPAPYIFWCGGGTNHAIDAPTPILIPGSRATFLSWSDGGAQAHAIACTAPSTFTATFLFEELVTIDTVPAGLQLALDGPTVTAPHSFWCAQNSGHTVDALSPQGTTGTRYAFASWSDSGARSHAILCDAPRTFTANFATEFEVTVATDPPGLDVLVDATLGTAPLTFWWADGSTHALDLTSPQVTGSTRFLFSGWSDGGLVAHSVTANAPAVVTASFTTQHRIDVASPRGTVSCGVADCWYDAGTDAGFGVTPATIPGPTGTRYVFDGWMGDSTAATASATLTMDGPKSVTARWRTEHLLTIVSPYGTPSGAGWYVEGSAAPVSIETSITDGGSTYRFTGWTGDAAGGTASISVTMDGPKTITATWERVTANPGSGLSSWLLWIVLLGVAVLLLVLFLGRRRKKEPDEPAPPPA
ncbi:MAG TPA: hypothetical protein VGR51_05235, partial [Thermoplasmata archaeon]|nr:hypothetical protein [Thermoplasmata archaeon]